MFGSSYFYFPLAGKSAYVLTCKNVICCFFPENSSPVFATKAYSLGDRGFMQF